MYIGPRAESLILIGNRDQGPMFTWILELVANIHKVLLGICWYIYIYCAYTAELSCLTHMWSPCQSNSNNTCSVEIYSTSVTFQYSMLDWFVWGVLVKSICSPEGWPNNPTKWICFPRNTTSELRTHIHICICISFRAAKSTTSLMGVVPWLGDS